jgi:hypothetical protein
MIKKYWDTFIQKHNFPTQYKVNKTTQMLRFLMNEQKSYVGVHV